MGEPGLDFGLDPFVENFVQLLTQVRDGVQAAKVEGFERGSRRREEIFESTVDGTVSRRRILVRIPFEPGITKIDIT